MNRQVRDNRIPIAKRLMPFGSILFLLLAITGCIPRQILLSSLNFNDISEMRQSSSDIPYTGQEIVIDNFVGKIVVEGVDLPAFVAGRPRVSVEWVKRVRNLPLEELEVDVESDSEMIHINSNAPDTIGRKLTLIPPFIEERVGFVEFYIRVPKEADLRLVQFVGMIEVHNFDGNLQIDQTAGITFSQRPGQPSISIHQSKLKELVVNGQSSDVALHESTFTEAQLTTSSGSISVELAQNDSVHLSGATDWSEILLTGAERIPADLISKETSWPGQRLEMLIGDGEADLVLHSNTGRINIAILH